MSATKLLTRARAGPLADLSPEQQRLVPRLRDRWWRIAASTRPADRMRAGSAVRVLYAAAGLPSPTAILWLDSPRLGDLVATRLANRHLKNRTLAAAVRRCRSHLVRRLFDDVEDLARTGRGDRVGGDVGYILRCAPLERARERLRGQVAGSLWSELEGRLRSDAVRSWRWQVSRTLHPLGLRSPVAGHGQQDAPDLALFDLLGRCGLAVSELGGLFELSKRCGWWWAFEGIAILTERPRLLEVDDSGRLHSGRGRAVEYRDGSGVYAWHGLSVEPELILDPRAVTPDQLLTESSPARQRVLIERIGLERIVAETSAAVIDSDTVDVVTIASDGRSRSVVCQDRVLVRVPLRAGEPIVAVRVRCPSTGNSYLLRVPPRTATCAEAVAWTFGFDQNVYRPALET